jgi:dienelactone hydrolase
LGDTKVTNQRLAVRTWNWWGVKAELFHVKWADGEAWEVKFNRLLSRIDAIVAEGHQIALVGASAGAGAVIDAYAARKEVVCGVVCIAGKVNNPHTIGGSYRRKSPAFMTAANGTSAAIDQLSSAQRARILSRYAPLDEVVPKRDSQIEGAKNRLSPTVGHFLTIALQITFGAPSFIHFLKRQQKHRI